jgi:hypothetical protein
MFPLQYLDETGPSEEWIDVTRAYLYDVQTAALKMVGEGSAVDVVSSEDLYGSKNTGVDRLYDAWLEKFIVGWDPTTGVPTLDVTTPGYPPIDTAAQTLARLVPLPAGLTLGPWRAMQVVE